MSICRLHCFLARSSTGMSFSGEHRKTPELWRKALWMRSGEPLVVKSLWAGPPGPRQAICGPPLLDRDSPSLQRKVLGDVPRLWVLISFDDCIFIRGKRQAKPPAPPRCINAATHGFILVSTT